MTSTTDSRAISDQTHIATGDAWEKRAESYLSNHGLQFVASNFRARGGEIDLIMRDQHTLVFVEVRFRGINARVKAAESVSAVKQRRMIHAAQLFLVRNPRWQQAVMRFDVVGIDQYDDGRIDMDWIRDAFRL